jgi:hypothetical protein
VEYRFSRYENNEEWNKDVPADLVPAIEALRTSFDSAHWKCSEMTRVFCFAALHPDTPGHDTKEYLTPLHQLQAIVGPAAAQHFAALLRESTPPSIFRAYYELYLEGVAVQTVDNLAHLIEIGQAHEARLRHPPLEWAVWHTKHMIRSHVHQVDIWMRDVCDTKTYDPTEDFDEEIFWTKWQAPRLLIMKPARSQPYDASTVWERLDPEASQKLRRAFVDGYVVRLESLVGKLAGRKAIELPKRPAMIRTRESDPHEAHVGPKARHVRQEARKLQTQAVHTKWQQEYRQLRRRRPEMSDVWCSQQIAKIDIGKGRSAETIRKHMKK